MGGRALLSEGIETRRASADEFVRVRRDVVDTLNSTLGGSKSVMVPESYRTKPSFGDLDVLIPSDHKVDDFVEYVSKRFGGSTVVSNGGVHSFDYRGWFQVDLITCPPDEMWLAHTYYSWNDLGNLMGRVVHKMGAKYGHNGLWLPFRDGTHESFQVNLLRDGNTQSRQRLPSEFFECFGFDEDRFYQGFDTLEQVYQYVASSKFFNPSMFALEDLNHTNRTRNRKRTTYMSFLQWIENDMLSREWYEWSADKSVYLPRLQHYFPEAMEEHRRQYMLWQQRKYSSMLYNGENVSHITGASGKQLGEFMAYVRRSFPPTFTSADVAYHMSFDMLGQITELWNQFQEAQYGSK